MNGRKLTLVVGGVTGLAEGLSRTGLFEQVFPVEATGGVRGLISSGALPEDKDQLIFVFADNLPCDTPQTPLAQLLQKLTVSGWKVIVVGVTAQAEVLVSQNPGAGLLNEPISVNLALGALAMVSGVTLPAVPDGFDYLGGDPVTAAPLPPSLPTPAAPVPHIAASPSGGAPIVWQPPTEGQPSPMSQPIVAPAPSKLDGADAWAPPAPASRVDNVDELVAPLEPEVPAGWSSPATDSWSAPAPQDGSGGDPAASGPFEAGTGSAAPAGWEAPAEKADAGWSPTTAPGASGWGTGGEGEGERRSLSGIMAPAEAPPAWQGGSTDGFAKPQDWDVPQEEGPAMRPGSYQAQHAPVSRRGWVITVAVPKGGAGKTGMALNLGAGLALRTRELGRTVCVIDSNIQQGDIGKYLHVYSPNILSLAKDPGSINRDRIAQYLVHKPELNCSFLLAPPRPEDANPKILSARLYCQVLEALRQIYDYIIIDTPVAEMYHDLLRDFALAQADFVIVPVAPNYATLHDADAWLHAAVVAPRHINGAGISPERIGIVLNRAEPGIGCDEDDVRAELASWLFLGSIPETSAWKLANNRGELVVTRNYSELNEAFFQILYGATGEEVLLNTGTHMATARSNPLSKIFGRFRKS